LANDEVFLADPMRFVRSKAMGELRRPDSKSEIARRIRVPSDDRPVAAHRREVPADARLQRQVTSSVNRQ